MIRLTVKVNLNPAIFLAGFIFIFFKFEKVTNLKSK